MPRHTNEGTELKKLGEELHSSRDMFLLENGIGMTSFYNLFHHSLEDRPKLPWLRDLHREIDLAVARAYGWDDLDLGHGFHEVSYLTENDRMRFTISESARIEVLRRLAELNHQRYEEEVAQGLHGKKKTAANPRSLKALSQQRGLDLGDRRENGSGT